MSQGISVCGSGVGAFVMAPLVRWLVNTYDWEVRKNVEILNIDGFLLPDCSPRTLGNMPLLRTFWGIDKAS